MEKHIVICDKCKTKADLKYNGEHYLPPEGWLELWDSNKAELIDQHLCPKCAPKKRKPLEFDTEL